MDDYYNVECNSCGWTGNYMDLECSEEDEKSKKPVHEIKFNRCPDCGSIDVSDIDWEEDYD